jgi:outer membrane lipoprotein-sorting protein
MKTSIQAAFGLILGVCLLLTAAVAVSAPTEPTPADILQQIDRIRLPQGRFEAEIVITPSKDGVLLEPGNYTVRTNGENQVLVEAKNPDQRGQKFLTTDSGIFFFAPRTKRAIRITPLQALRGQASIGDISRLHFSSDYSVTKPVSLQSACNDPACVVLELTSKSEAATYSRILLTAKRTHDDWQPVTASLFLASGKLTKTLEFGHVQAGLPPPTRYIDAINLRLETKVVFRSIKPAKFPPNMFNPRSLEQ